MISTCTILVTHGDEHFDRALYSVRMQSHPTRALVVVDGPIDRELDVPEAVDVDLIVLPRMVGTRRAFAAAVHLVEDDIVTFLDDANWFDESHVASLAKTITRGVRYNWAYAGRRYCAEGIEPTEDRVDHGVQYIDPQGIAVLRKLAVLASPFLADPSPKRLTDMLSGALHASTQKFTLNWRTTLGSAEAPKGAA